MSSPRVRSILLVVVLVLALPVISEAAGLTASRDGNVWSMVWMWLSQAWSGESRQLAGADATGGMALLSSADSGAPTTSGSSSGPICGGDQGVCIDPNG